MHPRLALNYEVEDDLESLSTTSRYEGQIATQDFILPTRWALDI